MADILFDASRGQVARLAQEDATVFGIMLLKTAESDANMKTRASLTEVLAHSTEANFTNYARKTGITGVLTIDTSGHVASVALPDQTWALAGGTLDNTMAKLVVFYEFAAADASRRPIVALDWTPTTDGGNLSTILDAVNGVWKAS